MHIPNLPSAGGFSITSTPSRALPSSTTTTSSSPSPPPPYIELAIQSSPTNPHALHLHRPSPSLLSNPLQIRIGGSFTFPPPTTPRAGLRRVVFVAGGMGVNPCVSMLGCIAEMKAPRGFDVRILYSTRDVSGEGVRDVLFLDRICDVVRKLAEDGEGGRLEVFLTGGGEDTSSSSSAPSPKSPIISPPYQLHHRRIVTADIHRALGPVEERHGTAVYVCGVPGMTEEVVKTAKSAEGMDMDGRCVFSERWW